MPKVHLVKAARRDYKQAGIKKGEPYYWWKFRYGGKQMSKTYPKPQQLTQSEFWHNVYDIRDELDALTVEAEVDELKSQVEEIVQRINDLADEQDEKRSNMPDHLQDVGSGETLQNRSDSLHEWADEVEQAAIDLEIDRDDYESDEEFEQAKQEAIDAITACDYNGE